MRDYGAIYTQFWTDPAMQSCTPSARLLACYLLTGPHTTMLGAFRLPYGYIYDDLGDGFGTVAEPFPNGFGTVSERFGELLRIGFATYCGSTKWVFVRRFLKWNPPQNPNQVTSVLKLFGQVPESCCFYDELCEMVGTVRERFGNSSGNRSETVQQPFRNQKQKQDQEQDQKQKKTGAVETQNSSRARAGARARTRTRADEPEEAAAGLEQWQADSTDELVVENLNGFDRGKDPLVSSNSNQEKLSQQRERIRQELAKYGVPTERMKEGL